MQSVLILFYFSGPPNKPLLVGLPPRHGRGTTWASPELGEQELYQSIAPTQATTIIQFLLRRSSCVAGDQLFTIVACQFYAGISWGFPPTVTASLGLADEIGEQEWYQSIALTQATTILSFLLGCNRCVVGDECLSRHVAPARIWWWFGGHRAGNSVALLGLGNEKRNDCTTSKGHND